MKKLPLSHILQNASQLATTEEKVAYLQQNVSTPLHMIIRFALHPDIKWKLPDGNPPYQIAENLDNEGILYSEARKLYMFIENGGYDNLTQIKREQLFISMLEVVHADDALLLLAIKDKRMPYKRMTARIFNLAFPEILPDTKEKD